MYLKVYEEVAELIQCRGSSSELADLIIMILDFGARRNYDIETVVREKMILNDQREWREVDGVMHHIE